MTLTREQILAMEPGRELDRIIAEKVMSLCVLDHIQQYGDGCVVSDQGWEEWTRHPECGRMDDPEFLPPYSTDIAAAWEVVEKMQGKGVYITIESYADFYQALTFRTDSSLISNSAVSLPKAEESICKAALLAVMEEETQ